jgi:hypothetical protein
MLVPLLIVLVGAIGRRGWFYWLFAGFAVFWLAVCYRLFFLGGADPNAPTGIISAALQSHFGDGLVLATWGVIAFILTYGGVIWLVRKGWNIEKTKQYPFPLSKKVKSITVGIWTLFGILQAAVIFSAYILSHAGGVR